ncbi:MAG: hypothetical protein D3910_13120, partial [Candidatus Electrothrix sp. ATG2]|nr:hypothetical protein [Candidatus Electrothrix sp. ATG2]
MCCLLAVTAQGKDLAQIAQIEVLDVETAQRIALQENPGIKAAQARLEQAKASLQQAVAADKPSVDASASTGLARYSDNNYDVVRLSDPSVDQNYTVGSLGLQASWLLFD